MSAEAPSADSAPGLATAAMRSLVGSLADNKAALGRRYAEWAVSAPTLESAVAAAAMAQDELGHSRSTYPVLKALGAEVAHDAPFGGDRRLALLDSELEDWSAAVAANLLVDGVLTTFVAACADSSVTALAQRARKILQEEGSHRIHAEAWARRLCRSGKAERELLVERLLGTWEQAGRWLGPADDPGLETAVAQGMVSSGAVAQRELMRSWLRGLLAAEGVALELDEPIDFSRWDPERRRWNPRQLKTAPSCPFCDCADVEQVGQWGGQMITAQWRCRGCGSYFEAIRESLVERAPAGEDAPRQSH